MCEFSCPGYRADMMVKRTVQSLKMCMIKIVTYTNNQISQAWQHIKKVSNINKNDLFSNTLDIKKIWSSVEITNQSNNWKGMRRV